MGMKPMRRSSLRPPSLRQFWGAGVTLAMLSAMLALGVQAGHADQAGSVSDQTSDQLSDPWPDLVRDAFNGRPMADGTGVLAIEMPYRAEDAAIVPVTLRLTLPPEDTR